MSAKRKLWVIGIALAVTGVILARLLASLYEKTVAGFIIYIAGIILALAGLGIIVAAIRKAD